MVEPKEELPWRLWVVPGAEGVVFKISEAFSSGPPDEFQLGGAAAILGVTLGPKP